MFTSNNIVCENTVITGNISYQITGLAPFTDSPFVTIGNDWALGKEWVSGAPLKDYTRMVTEIGTKLAREGWRGLFGIDAMYDIKREVLYLIEINARQPASTTYESQLQAASKDAQIYYTTFDGHLQTLADHCVDEKKLIQIYNGAQIILRNQAGRLITETQIHTMSTMLSALGFTCIAYPNTEPGTDRLRIQSATSMFRAPGKFNEVGKAIVDCINQILK